MVRRFRGIIFGTYIVFDLHNDLPNDLQSNLKLSADEMSLFFTLQDINRSPGSRNNDLRKISKWASNTMKMGFNSNV